jgi:GNAT superfamily N-acetyltransferase
VVAAVRELLVELGGTPPPTAAMETATRALIDDRRAGALLVAQAGGVGLGDGAVGGDAGGAIVGVLGASWQAAIHIPGRYGLIQDLWVHPAWRGRAIGRELLAAIFELARELRVARIEVGLPPERFPGLEATEAFYLANGFTAIGSRMRWTLP